MNKPWKRRLLAIFLLQPRTTTARLAAFVPPHPKKQHHYYPKGPPSQQLKMSVDLDTTMWTIAAGTVAYYSTYATDGYEPHAM
mmetsp:Transcript_24250/g.28572  ORF Transcript_24250/g.28572 Transcript_24250/m.28572 type:complete len:83 (+) Transcript_24250:65-313(+)